MAYVEIGRDPLPLFLKITLRRSNDVRTAQCLARSLPVPNTNEIKISGEIKIRRGARAPERSDDSRSDTGAAALAKMKAGASLIQFYGALIFHGLRLLPAIKSDLSNALRRGGHTGIGDLVGVDAHHRGEVAGLGIVSVSILGAIISACQQGALINPR
jgi:hypothetical protein